MQPKTESMQTLNHNLRPYLVGTGLLAAAILLCWVAFRGCYNAPSHKQEAKQVEQEQKALQKADDSTTAVIERLKVDSAKLATENADLKKKLATVRQEVAAGRQQAGKLIADLDNATANADTSRFIQAAQDLRDLVEVQGGVIAHYEDLFDSTIVNYDAQLVGRDSIIAAQAVLLAQFRAGNASLSEKYFTLNKDNLALSRKLKGERTLGRVLAIGAGVLGVMVLTK